MMRPAGLEPAAFGAGNRRSDPLSYGRVQREVRDSNPRPREELPFSRRVHSAALPTSPTVQYPRRDSNPRTPLARSQADRENPLPYQELHPVSVLLQPAACDPFRWFYGALTFPELRGQNRGGWGIRTPVGGEALAISTRAQLASSANPPSNHRTTVGTRGFEPRASRTRSERSDLAELRPVPTITPVETRGLEPRASRSQSGRSAN